MAGTNVAWRGCLVLAVVAGGLAGSAAAEDAALPEPLAAFLGQDLELPRLHEGYYHPLGRSPVVDAVLADPFYLPTFGRSVSAALRKAAEQQQCLGMLETALRAGAVPLGALAEPKVEPIPGLADTVGKPAADVIARAWADFLAAHEIAEAVFKPLELEERAWLLQHPDAWFFDDHSTGEYVFFTTDTILHRGVFELAARLDLARLADAERHLARAADEIAAHADLLRKIEKPFRTTGEGPVLVVGGPGDDRYEEPVDLLIDVGGDDLYLNNAGGTGGERWAALLVDLGGDDRYEAGFAAQGTGFLGVGGLLDLEGDDRYFGSDFVQGAGWLGGGFLIDWAGDDEYEAEFYAQGAAGFGFGLLWDQAGEDEYRSLGFAQAASTTLGVAFLVDSAGADRYHCGGPRRQYWGRSLGIGQGAAVGVRGYPWDRTPSMYGGVALLDDAAGDDRFYCPVFGQGASYMLGLGALIDSGGDDEFIGHMSTQGAGVHLAAGLLVKEGGDDYYSGGWGSTGVGSDRAVGVFIDTGGDDRYRGLSHNFGTARQMQALGLFIDAAGQDTYEFTGASCGRVQPPMDPEAWPRAVFADLGGEDEYPEEGGDDGPRDGEGVTWRFHEYGTGLDAAVSDPSIVSHVWAAFRPQPRAGTRLDRAGGWAGNTAFRPVVTTDWPADAPMGRADREDVETEKEKAANAPAVKAPAPIAAWLAALEKADYDGRRQAYERLDLLRFSTGEYYDWAALGTLLENPAGAPDDLLAYAAVWAELDRNAAAGDALVAALERDTVKSPYTRRLLIRALGQTGANGARTRLASLVARDPDVLCRAEAARQLGRITTAADFPVLSQAAQDRSSLVRLAVCAGLRDQEVPGALDVVQPLLTDEDLYVRRAAALTAVSLRHKPAIPLLLECLRDETLDVGGTYRRSLLVELSRYVDFNVAMRNGTNLDLWWVWWRESGEEYSLPGAP